MFTRLKVCRVDTPLGAKAAASAGAAFVGLHAISPWEFSYAQIQNFKRINRYLAQHAPHCRAVLLTRSRDASFIAEVCALTEVSLIQLHENFETTDVIHHLENEFKQRALPPPVLIKTIVLGTSVDLSEVAKWSTVTYALLFDSTHTGGSGKKADWDLIRRGVAIAGHDMTFVAGGLTKHNVKVALSESGASFADIQSSLEIPGRKRPHMKDVVEILAVIAEIDGKTVEEVRKHYCWRRANFRILFSPTELSCSEGSAILEKLVSSDIDGIQIDAADGSIEVNPWPVTPQEWAQLAWQQMPEAPIWLHLFSRDQDWIVKMTSSVAAANPHLVGVFLQIGQEIDNPVTLIKLLREELRVPVLPSVTVRQVEEGKMLESLLSEVRFWQITTPHNSERPYERIASAIERLSDAGVTRIGLDRAVDLSVLRGLTRLPHSVTIGRGLKSGMNGDVDAVIELLGEQKTRPT